MQFITMHHQYNIKKCICIVFVKKNHRLISAHKYLTRCEGIVVGLRLTEGYDNKQRNGMDQELM